MLYLYCLFAGHILNAQLMSQYLCLENCVLVTDYCIDQGDGNLHPVGQIHFNTYFGTAHKVRMAFVLNHIRNQNNNICVT